MDLDWQLLTSLLHGINCGPLDHVSCGLQLKSCNICMHTHTHTGRGGVHSPNPPSCQHKIPPVHKVPSASTIPHIQDPRVPGGTPQDMGVHCIRTGHRVIETGSQGVKVRAYYEQSIQFCCSQSSLESLNPLEQIIFSFFIICIIYNQTIDNSTQLQYTYVQSTLSRLSENEYALHVQCIYDAL